MKTKLVSLVLLLSLVIAIAPVRASDAYEIYWEWYSDATMTEMVGYRYEYCGGTADYWGYQTAYSQRWVGARCVDGGGGTWQTWCAVPAGTPCPAQCAWCQYY